MGEVFLATQLAMGRKVALKVLPGHLIPSSDMLERFLQEARMAGTLRHPNTVTAYDAGKDHTYYYIVMAFVDGMTLKGLLQRQATVPEKQAVGICMSVAEALAHAWENGRILHRDVKPGNIMITNEGQPMVMDMGIAKSVQDDSNLTATGIVMGTPHYMSPEQAKGSRSLDFRTDMYSLGVTLFHLVTGGPPFTGRSSMEVVAKHLHDPRPSVRLLNPEISEGCDALIQRMMARERNDRYASWGACLKDMHAVLKGRASEAARAMVARRALAHSVYRRQAVARRKARGTASRIALVPWLVAGICLLAAAATVILAVAPREDHPTPVPRSGYGTMAPELATARTK